MFLLWGGNSPICLPTSKVALLGGGRADMSTTRSSGKSDHLSSSVGSTFLRVLPCGGASISVFACIYALFNFEYWKLIPRVLIIFLGRPGRTRGWVEHVKCIHAIITNGKEDCSGRVVESFSKEGGVGAYIMPAKVR